MGYWSAHLFLVQWYLIRYQIYLSISNDYKVCFRINKDHFKSIHYTLHMHRNWDKLCTGEVHIRKNWGNDTVVIPILLKVTNPVMIFKRALLPMDRHFIKYWKKQIKCWYSTGTFSNINQNAWHLIPLSLEYDRCLTMSKTYLWTLPKWTNNPNSYLVSLRSIRQLSAQGHKQVSCSETWTWLGLMIPNAPLFYTCSTILMFWSWEKNRKASNKPPTSPQILP